MTMDGDTLLEKLFKRSCKVLSDPNIVGVAGNVSSTHGDGCVNILLLNVRYMNTQWHSNWENGLKPYLIH